MPQIEPDRHRRLGHMLGYRVLSCTRRGPGVVALVLFAACTGSEPDLQGSTTGSRRPRRPRTHPCRRRTPRTRSSSRTPTGSSSHPRTRRTHNADAGPNPVGRDVPADPHARGRRRAPAVSLPPVPPYFLNAGVSTLAFHRGNYWLNHQLSGFRVPLPLVAPANGLDKPVCAPTVRSIPQDRQGTRNAWFSGPPGPGTAGRARRGLLGQRNVERGDRVVELSSMRGPAIGDVTAGFASNHASATRPGGLAGSAHSIS